MNVRVFSDGIVVASCVLACCNAVGGGIDTTKFNVGTYSFDRTLFADESAVIDLKDAGIDFVCGRPPGTNRIAVIQALDHFAKHDVGWFIEGGNTFMNGLGLPYVGKARGKLATMLPAEVYESAALAFKPHPAIWGFDMYDEPTAVDFPRLGEVCEEVRRLFPGRFPYINLFPSYAAVAKNSESVAKSQLGTLSYQEYIDRYCQDIPLDYISFDFYPYVFGRPEGVRLFHGNLRIVADACLKTGRSLWVVLQANSTGKTPLAEDCMRYQAYAAMSFGAVVVNLACWTPGWFEHNVVDPRTHEKTVTYDRVKRVAAELHAIGGEFMRYRRTATHFVGYEAHQEYLKGSGMTNEKAVSAGWIRDVRAEDGGPLMVSEMVSRDPCRGAKYALFVFASDDPYADESKDRKVLFRLPNRSVRALGVKGSIQVRRRDDGCCEIDLKSNHVAMILLGTK